MSSNLSVFLNHSLCLRPKFIIFKTRTWLWWKKLVLLCNVLKIWVFFFCYWELEKGLVIKFCGRTYAHQKLDPGCIIGQWMTEYLLIKSQVLVGANSSVVEHLSTMCYDKSLVSRTEKENVENVLQFWLVGKPNFRAIPAKYIRAEMLQIQMKILCSQWRWKKTLESICF